MSKIIIFDFEVFAKDCLLGARVLNEDKYEVFQTWSLKAMRQFYADNQNAIWIGHNNEHYDNYILQGVVNGLSEKELKTLSDKIINEKKRFKLNIPLYYYDLMSRHRGSLKAVEAACGKKISTSEVDFNLNRTLTDEEKRLTESYNRDDLEQTYDDLMLTMSEFELRLNIIKEFGLSLNDLPLTSAQISAKVLHAQRIDGIGKQITELPKLDRLRLNNEQVLNYYRSMEFKNRSTLEVTLCDVPHTIQGGGAHAARENCSFDWALYFDVSGYYNLIMIIYNLLPRSIPDEYKPLYEHMYHEQLRLKKINPRMRAVYKEVLLAVFGAQNNQYSDFFDPWQADLVTIIGQLFICDLIEKLEGKVTLIQTNTDGVIAKPLDGVSEEEIASICKEWQERTGFVLKFDKIYDIRQRDVNNYMYRDDKGEIHLVGEAVKYYGHWENPLDKNVFMSKEPVILQYMIVDYMMYGILPEETLAKYMHDLRMFQYICKRTSYDYILYRVHNLDADTFKDKNVGSITRGFASAKEGEIGQVFRRTWEGKSSKIAGTPSNIFLYEDEILSEESVNKLTPLIDWQYYIDRGYKRIGEYMGIKQIQTIN